MNEVQKLKELRATTLAAAKEIITRAQARPEAERDLTAEENVKVDELYAEFDRLGKRIETVERMSTLERAEAQLNEVTRRTAPTNPNSVLNSAQPASIQEAVRTWMLRGHGITHEQIHNANLAGIDVNSACITIRYNADGIVGAYNGDPATMKQEPLRRDLATTTGTSAMTQWREFTNVFDKALIFRGRALNHVTRIRTMTGDGLPIPKVDDTAQRGHWLAEGSSAANNDPSLASVTLGAFKATSDKVPISIEALQDDQVTMNMLLPMILGERIGSLFNKAVTNGAGTTEPRGILLDAADSGVTIGGTNAAPTYSWDDLLDLKTSVDPAYREADASKRGFMLSDTLFRKYRKLKDANSRYYVDPMQPGPGYIDGDPIFLNNDVPATGVGEKVAAYGDFSRYFWRDVMEVTFYRLDQVAILDGKIVFIAFARADGRLINTSAVKYLNNPAS